MGIWFILCFIYLLFYFLSSPFLFVYGDDRVIRYTGADVDIGGAEDVQATEWGLALGLELGFFSLVLFMLLFMNTFILRTCNPLLFKLWVLARFLIKLNFPMLGLLVMRLLI